MTLSENPSAAVAVAGGGLESRIVSEIAISWYFWQQNDIFNIKVFICT